VQTSCADAKYAQYFTAFWQAVMGVYSITLICSLPLACSRWRSFKESVAKLPPGSGLKGRIACMQTADWLVIQLIAGIVLRLIQSVLLLLHADTVLPRILFEIIFELCIHSSLKFAHMFLEFLTLLVSKLRRGTHNSPPLQPGQLFALDCAGFAGFVLLGCLDGLWSGVRSIALWWYLAAVTLLYLLLFKEVGKGMRQVRTALTVFVYHSAFLAFAADSLAEQGHHHNGTIDQIIKSCVCCICTARVRSCKGVVVQSVQCLLYTLVL
jgi:hypothetical protein